MEWVQLLSSERSQTKKTATVQLRSEFERDFDRIIFSHPFRKLQDKTQVIPLPEPDFVHSRLTHSLEASSVGRSLGKKVGEQLLGQYPDLTKAGYVDGDIGSIVAAACLAHDLGNPPFGHSGEDAISYFFRSNPKGRSFESSVSAAEWADLVCFEGNAQGFRILNQARYQGLNLTLATLASFSKYPRGSDPQRVNKTRASQKKYGFFQSEKNFFHELATRVGLNQLGDSGDEVWCRHPLAFLVEAADDICYHIIDLEDGCRLGWVPFKDTVDLLAPILGDRFNAQKFDAISGDGEKVGLLRAMAINELVDQSAQVFWDHQAEILDGKFDQPLTTRIEAKSKLDQIIEISVLNIYRSQEVLEAEASGLEVLEELLECVTTAALIYHVEPQKLTKKHQTTLEILPDQGGNLLRQSGSTIYGILMACIDVVSGLTDSGSISLNQRLKGISGKSNLDHANR